MDVMKWTICKIYAYSDHLLFIYIYFNAKQQSITSLMNICGPECTDHSYSQNVYDFANALSRLFSPFAAHTS